MAIVAVCFGFFEFIAADNGDLWRIMTADRMGLVLKLYWRFVAALGGVSRFNSRVFHKKIICCWMRKASPSPSFQYHNTYTHDGVLMEEDFRFS